MRKGIQIAGMLTGVLLMGFSISWLVPCGFGTDAFTAMNLAISERIGVSFGTWQAGLNTVLFVLVLLFGRRYICDFFSWIWSLALPADFFAPLLTRVLVAVPALGLFVLAAAVYMDMDLGMAPYDALPFLLHRAIGGKVPFSVLRMAYDLAVIALGYAFGAPFAAVTLAMAFLLGPAVAAVRRGLDRLFFRPQTG